MVRLGAVAVAIVSAALLLTSPALGASACASAVLRDWSADGRVGPKYSLPCYEEAIDALPSDLRDYTDAEDVITRALTSALRTSGSAQSVDESPVGRADGRSSLTLAALAAIAFVMLCAGSLAYAARRRRALGGSDDRVG